MSDPPTDPELDPKRFEVARTTLWVDRAMTYAIRVGGLGVIVAVFGIFIFIFKEVVPLFGTAEVAPMPPVAAEAVSVPKALGVDEWGEMPYLYSGGSSVTLVEMSDGRQRHLPVAGLDEIEVTAVAHDPLRARVAVGTRDGRVGSFVIRYESVFDDQGRRRIEAAVEVEPWFQLGAGEGPVRALAYGEGSERSMIVAVRGDGEDATTTVLRLGRKRSLLGAGTLALLSEDEVSESLPAGAKVVRASPTGRMALVATADGSVVMFEEEGEGVMVRQTFKPFDGEPLAGIDFLFGGMTAVITATDGRQEGWSLFRSGGEGRRVFGQTKEFAPLDHGAPVVFAASQRNKSFLAAVGREVSLRYGTTADVRWRGEAAFAPELAVFDGKSEHIVLAAADGRLQRLTLDDPHPEASWRAFFGKVWYEGASAPEYQWQSTGGSDEFESKLSLVPLVFGSIKGTVYAMVFSVPIALLAAVFSASFLSHGAKRLLKPSMEIMASLPSVVLGFLAGLWLAPLIEDKIPSLLLVVLAMPLTALLVGYLIGLLPLPVRSRFESGREWWVVMPFLALAVVVAWQLGPVLERVLFVYQDPATGREIADFRLWWPQATGTSFDQRNSVVVGFMVGFAVIPVIFTIAEDALSNVPASLTAASAALGASRWQVVRTVVLPIASPGIFSALMIGFGRAVGETMIMVMATGNTPLMEWNIFSGMRTLAANIAVELPEAPVGSTHYRTLFLGAMILFLMTFVLNTAAEVLRNRLRERFKLV